MKFMTKSKLAELLYEAKKEGYQKGHKAGHEKGYGEGLHVGLTTKREGIHMNANGIYKFDDGDSLPLN